MFARNMLLSNGEEVVLTISSSAYFSLQENTEVYAPLYDEVVEQAARQRADGIFRVWSTNLDEQPSSGSQMLNGDYPLSDAARAIRTEWDPSDNALLDCSLWQMPRLMGNPLPLEFVRQGSDIAVRFEEDDQERVIHMDANHADAPADLTVLGYSTGHWEGDTLVVETSQIEADRLDSLGTPLSSAIHLLERFTATADWSRLNYAVTVTDPGMFTAPFDLQRYWVWRPEIVVEGYSCNEEDRFG